MLNISRIYCGVKGQGDRLRYKNSNMPKRPVVVWNVTEKCNLYCAHCYANATCSSSNSNDLTTEQGFKLIEHLAEFNVPVLLFSGGEPLLRKDIFELIEYTGKLGIKPTLSTNGTLIDRNTALRLKNLGITYVGISIDGTPEKHNKFRGDSQAFQKAMDGIRHCIDQGVRVGLRFTMHRNNAMDIPYVIDLMEKENIPRICFYHLVNSGRGKNIQNLELSVDEKRNIMDLLTNRAQDFADRRVDKEILTVANHCDSIYLYLKMLRENHSESEEAMNLISINKNNSSGLGICSINWDGDVYPDQFWRNKILGNVLDRKFGEIWECAENDFLKKLRDRRNYIHGRCAQCRYFDICGGNFRPRAESYTGDMWASDPGCYLYDNEILEVDNGE